MRWRIAVFLAALVGIAVWMPPPPWGMVAGVAVYFAVVWPALNRKINHDREDES